MAKKVRAALAAPKSQYFADEKKNIRFVKSGCQTLNCALGGGYPLGRVTNLIGDRSTGKTGLATEAMINFTMQYPGGQAHYREAESAWDDSYAEAMGLPLDRVDFGSHEGIITIEALEEDLMATINEHVRQKEPGIFIIDSLDAVSDDAELEAKAGQQSGYGTAKAKKLGAMLRKAVGGLEEANINLFVISQVRENIGAMPFQPKMKRSGGKALDFYESQEIWLAQTGTISPTKKGIKRVTGLNLKATVKKNKVGLAFRSAEFNFMFGFGIDDLQASIDWLIEVNRLDEIGMTKANVKKDVDLIVAMPDVEYKKEVVSINKVVRKVWSEVETTFLPTRSKYA